MSGRGLCDKLIISPEESYRLWCVVVCDLETSWMRRPWPTGGCYAKNKQTNKQTNKQSFRNRTTATLPNFWRTATMHIQYYALILRTKITIFCDVTPRIWSSCDNEVHVAVYTRLQVVSSQKITIFVLTTVITLNLVWISYSFDVTESDWMTFWREALWRS